MYNTFRFVLFGLFFLYIVGSASAAENPLDFNDYIIKSIDLLNNKYGRLGYDINAAFTHDLPYPSDPDIVKSLHPPKTMCVAAVAEVILTAIKLYSEETGDESVFRKIPKAAWTNGNLLSLRANIFMYSGTGSKGTADTLSKFQLGEELRFQDLKKGDFVNLNRTKTGHSVVFLGFVNSNLDLVQSYSNDIVGFRYFSSQGKGEGSGLGFRYAYFGSYCPSNSPEKRDCGVIRSNNPALLNVGRMWSPDKWNYLGAVAQKKSATRNAIIDENPTASRGAIDTIVDQMLERSLEFSDEQVEKFDGATTD